MQYDDGSTSPIKAFFRQKWVKAILIVDIIAILIVAGVLIWQATKVSTINFNITPLNATISVNGNTGFTNGQYKITPGTYEIKISHEDLEPKTFTIDIEPHHVVSVATFLKDAGKTFEFYELKENYESYQKLAAIASTENNITTDKDTSAEEFIEKFEHILSLLKILPIKGYTYAEPSVSSSTAGFTIRKATDQSSCEKTSCLLVNYYGKDYEEAVKEKIKEAGYNPADYQLFYERYD